MIRIMENDTCAVKIAVRERGVVVREGEQSAIRYSANPNVLIVDDRPFTFDYVLAPTTTQQQLFDGLIKPLVHKVKQGYNCTALAYGQTGTGKSYTMGLNLNTLVGEQVGLIPRCLEELFESATENDENKQRVEHTIHASFIEIYNEKAYDLFAENTVQPIASRGSKYTGGTRKALTSIEQCYSILMQGTKNRHVRPTQMNSESSRSHAVFTIHVRSINGPRTTTSCLNLVDLAGSEGVRRTGHQGVALSEGVNINQGLLCIGKVLQAMALGKKIIPYRDSVLSLVLQDSLHPNSYLTLLACISPNHVDLSETLSTLRFAQNAKQIKHNPQVNAAILAEIKKNKFKTPSNKNPKSMEGNKRHFSTLHKPQSSTSKPNKIQHSNTFSTPNKKKANYFQNKFNNTEMGLTPKEKKKVQQTGIIRPIIPFRSATQSNFELTDNRESLFDHSLNSLMSLNVSSSTAIDAPKVPSYSPVVRKCIAEFENIMENKMQEMMANLNSFRLLWESNTMSSTPYAANNQNTQQLLPITIREELKNIMQEMVKNNVEEQGATGTRVNDNVACKLFTTSSPIFKVPEIPMTPVRNILNDQLTIDSTINLTKQQDESGIVPMFSLEDTEQTVTKNVDATRRSSRISQRMQLKASSTTDSSIGRESAISSRQRHGNIQKSLKRLQDGKHKLGTHLEVPGREIKKKLSESSKLINLKKHKKAILDLLNTGSMKELQVLPQVGQKTAYQLVVHRTINGRFKSLTHVEKLPIWRGKAWERFAEANILK